jgi:hypothetical protein
VELELGEVLLLLLDGSDEEPPVEPDELDEPDDWA